MPRYRVIKPVPEVLPYSNGKVFFEDYPAEYRRWVWYVRREAVARDAVILCHATDRGELDILRRSGFETVPGSKADRLMRSLVAKGFAEMLATE